MSTSRSLGSRWDGSPARARWARRAALSAVVLGLAASVGVTEASAQTKEELAKARELFLEGVALASGNNCAGAIAKYKEVARVKMTPQVAFNIAECEERLGKLVSALGNYRLAQTQLEDPKVKAKAKEVASQVDARVASLEERIPKLTIQRGKGAEMALLSLDGTELGSSQVGQEIQLDPGPHEIVAKVGEKEASRQAVTLAERESKTVEIEVDLAALNKVDKPVETKPVQVTLPPEEPEKGGSIVPGAVVTGVGVAALAAGAVLFFGPRQSTINELDEKCGGDSSCPSSAASIADKGKLYTGIAEVAAGVGLVGVTVGIILMATSGGKKKKPTESTEPAASASALSVPGTSGRVIWTSSAPGADKGGVGFMGRF
jgi:hypothetical protein